MKEDGFGIHLLNILAISLSFSDVEATLKMATYCVSIGFTTYTWYKDYKKHK